MRSPSCGAHHAEPSRGAIALGAAASDARALAQIRPRYRQVGIVKLMGRDAGFVAAHAALASNLVDLCLIPEVTVTLDDIKEWVDATLVRVSPRRVAGMGSLASRARLRLRLKLRRVAGDGVLSLVGRISL